MGIVKVTDASTEKVKRYEDEHGKAIAIRRGNKLVLTDLGRSKGYKINGLKVVNRTGYPLA